jgi:amidohydrolase
MIELDDSLVSWVAGLRRWFHQHPEPSFEERKTQDKIVDILGELGIEHRRAGETGVIADIHGNDTGRTIALRSDMDALRIQEAETDLNPGYRSQNDGVMHACGHDGHMAMLLGAARWLQEHWDTLGGNVRLIFQPAEEVPPGGAGLMIAEGCLDGVDAIIAAHIFGNMPVSKIGFRPGPFMASSRTFKVTIKGKPGHHMCPQDNIDPIQIAARFISTIQTDIRQRLNPNARYVLGFGEVHAGMQHNQTPAEAEVIGTFRAYDVRDSETIAGTIRSNLDGLMVEFSRDRDFTTKTPRHEEEETTAKVVKSEHSIPRSLDPLSPVPGSTTKTPRHEEEETTAKIAKSEHSIPLSLSPSIASYILDAEPAYPPLINNPAFTRRAAEVLKQNFDNVDDDMEPNLGAEDFACYLDRVPGLFMFLGGGNPARGITAMNHSDRFDMDEAVLPTGIKTMLTLATDFLSNPVPYLDR